MVCDILELELAVELPASTKGLSVHNKGMSTSTQLARDLRQQPEAFTVDVLLSRRAEVLAAFLGVLGASATICDICKGWSRG